MLRPLKNKHCVIAVAFAASFVLNSGYAEVITPDAALGRYLTSFQIGTRSRTTDFSLSYTATDEREGIPAYYAFSKVNEGGFVVLSADDRLRPVLGYTDSGKFDPDQIPSDLKWFLEGYIREISYAIHSGLIDSSSPSATRSESLAPISPMVKTKWDQGRTTAEGDAYNSLCPRIGSRKCYAGCVPVSMSQVMNYHKWPQTHGNGSWEYIWSYDQSGTSMSRVLDFDYENTVFDWDNMLDEYSRDGGTEAQNAAISRLLYACGVSVEASYSTDATGAYSDIVADALRTFFGYDSMAHYLKRDFFSTEQWEEIIYDELKEGRPVIYGGCTKDDGGHSFVCDGYDGNGLFHINWGWGGMSDGYFSLSALNPYEQGAGSYDGGYNYYQDITVGIQPPTGSDQEYSLLYVQSGSFELTSISDQTGRMTFKLPGWLINDSLFPHVYTLGVKIIDVDGDDVGIMESRSGALNLDGYVRGGMYMDWGKTQYKSNYSFTTSTELYNALPQGIYTLMPVYKTDMMDWSQLYTDYEPHTVSVTVGESGIAEIENNNIGISVEGAAIAIRGLQKDEAIDVYNPAGRLVASARSCGDNVIIPVEAKGVYIVKCGVITRKVMIK